MSNMPNDKHFALLALCLIKKLSWYLIAREANRPNGLDRLLEGRVSENSLEASEAEYLLAEHLDGISTLIDEARARVESALNDGIRLTTVLDDDYPLNLRTIFNRPPFLLYKGELREDDAFSVAVVGTRKPSVDGLKRADKMATLLSERGVTVLSGLARGIDTAAHSACLAAGGRTVAVLGSGIRKMYPPENSELAERIILNGALVSQFWPDTPPASYSFPRRNITMSGLGQGTIVIEASATSGAKMQARLALEHGKKVFLVQSLVANHEWAQKYLKRGAIKVSDVADIISHLRSPEVIRESARQQYQLNLGL
jgi:DNA processing protein